MKQGYNIQAVLQTDWNFTDKYLSSIIGHNSEKNSILLQKSESEKILKYFQKAFKEDSDYLQMLRFEDGELGILLDFYSGDDWEYSRLIKLLDTPFSDDSKEELKQRLENKILKEVKV